MKDFDLSEQLHGAATKAANYAEARLELLQCEWAIERLRLAALMESKISMLFFSFLTVVLVVLLITAWFWDTPMRVVASAVTAGASLFCAVAASLRHRSKRNEPSALFQKSLEEFARDRKAIDALR